ncbi:hypothetical protein Unana1_03119 [Umbelopsis nana]
MPSNIDMEKVSPSYDGSVNDDHFAEQHRLERKLVRKLDTVILPITMCMYLGAYLDRGNAGNARLQGLQAEVLGGSDTRFSVCLSMFYVSYIALNIPGNMLAKVLPPSKSLALATFVWGVAATCQAAVTNYAGLIVCRLLIGVGEAGFGAAVALYYSLWYKKDEIATRIALFIGCGALAGTFGGLIAYGVSHIQSTTISDWRILFIIEGLPSVALSIIVFFFLPDRPETSNYLTEDERAIANTRLNMQVGPSEGPRHFEMRSLKRALTDYKNWMICGMYLGLNLTLGSISGFLPTIIATLGYSSVNAQLYTVPPYAVAVVYMAVVSFLSDRYKIRGMFVFFDAMIAVIGFAILIGVKQNEAVRYFAVFLIVAPTFTNIPLCLSWASNNNATESSKAVALGLINSIGQCFSILASFSFPSSQGPLYIQGMALNLAFSVLTGLLGLSLFIILKMENKRRDSIEGPPPENLSRIETAQYFDKATGFRYVP